MSSMPQQQSVLLRKNSVTSLANINDQQQIASPRGAPTPRTNLRRQTTFMSVASNRKLAPTMMRQGSSDKVNPDPLLDAKTVSGIINNDGVDRAEWKKKAFSSHTDLLDLKQRINPLARAIKFIEIYRPERKGIGHGVTRDFIIQLIIQHLHVTGLKASAVALQKESQVKYSSHGKSESQLLKHLHKSMKVIENIYDYALEEKPDLDKDYVERTCYELNLVKIEQHGESIRDVNIWEEEENEKTQIIEGNEVKAGTLNRLIVKLTSEKEPDMTFMKTFLMTYQSFATPEKLLSKLIERFNIPPELEGNRGTAIQLRVCNVIKKWIEEYFSDFDQELVSGITEFTQQLGRQDSKTMDSLRIQILKTMERMKQKDQQKRKTRLVQQPPEPRVNIKTIFSKMTFMDIDEEELARQITLADYEIYFSIRPQELLNQSWSKPKLKHRSPNVLKMIYFFNCLSLWVAVTVLQVEKVKERAKVMAKVIKLGEHLKALKNFNSVMAVIAGLNLSAVQRLQWTKRELPAKSRESFLELEKLMSSEGNYSRYRTAIGSSEPPCLPYLGVHLTDLVFVDENPDYVGGLINFTKRKLVNMVITKFLQFHSTPFNIQPVSQILSYIQKLPSVDEQSLYVLSMSREPRKAQRHEIQ